MQFRRKKKFIDPKFQIQFGMIMLMMTLIFFGLIITVLFIPPVSNWFNPGIDTRVMMNDFFNLLVPKWPLILLVVVVMFIFGNLFSHTLAGPAFRFRSILESLNSKNLDIKFHLRKWDFHKELEPLFKTHINDMREMVVRFSQNIETAETALKNQDTTKAKESLDKIKKEVAGFKL